MPNLEARIRRAELRSLLLAPTESEQEDWEGYPWKDREDPFWTPLSFREFVEKHLRVKLYPNQIADLEQVVGTDPKLVFSPDNPLPQLGVIAIGKGGGKGFTVSCFFAWTVCTLLCLKNIATYLGQADGENIDAIIVSYNKRQAQSILLHKVKARLKQCQWFRQAIARITGQSFDRYQKENFGVEAIKIPGNLTIWAKPATEGSDGFSPILIALDEVGAWSSPVKMNIAARIHEILQSSAQSRFGKRWRGFILSYPRHSEDYLCQLLKLYNRGVLENAYCVTRATWEWNEGVSKETFAGDYKQDSERAAMLYECRPRASVDSFFKQPEMILRNASGAPLWLLKDRLPDLSEDLLNIIVKRGDNPILEVDSRGDFITDQRGFPKLAPWAKGKPGVEYVAVLDPALNGDSFGFCVAHLELLPKEKYLIVIDLMFRWTVEHFRQLGGQIYRQSWFPELPSRFESIADGEIDQATPREFLFYLKFGRGFEFSSITFDAWNSAESIQQLLRRDIQAYRYQVKKRDYSALKDLIYAGSLKYFAHPIFVEEGYRLQLLHNDKIECPRFSDGVGSRLDSHGDVINCVAAAARQLWLKVGDEAEMYEMPEIKPEDKKKEKTQDLGQIQEIKNLQTLSETQEDLLELLFFGDTS